MHVKLVYILEQTSWHVFFSLHTQLSHSKRVIASSNSNDNNYFNRNHYNKHYKLNFISAWLFFRSKYEKKDKQQKMVCSLLIAKQRQNMYAHTQVIPAIGSVIVAIFIVIHSSQLFAWKAKLILFYLSSCCYFASFLPSISVSRLMDFFSLVLHSLEMCRVGNGAANMEERSKHALICDVHVFYGGRHTLSVMIGVNIEWIDRWECINEL